MKEPKEGEIRLGKEIGESPHRQYTYCKCIDCRIGRWLTYISKRCRPCSRKKMRDDSLIRPLDLNNPKAGDVCSGRLLGKSYDTGIYLVCPNCGYGRWVKKEPNLVTGIRKCQVCGHQNGRCREKASNWKGGRYVEYNGYVVVNIPKENPYFVMAKHKSLGAGEVREHRLIMAQHLKRPLKPCEIVHHKNGIKTDNRLENLILTTNGKHRTNYRFGYKEGFDQGYADGLTLAANN